MNLKVFLTALFACLSFVIYSQTTVYVCSTNGAYGYCYGNSSTSSCAYNECIQRGGVSPSNILRVSSKGYGAIAVGKDSNGAQKVGAAAGYSSLAEAKQRAIEECKFQGGINPSITRTFHDKEGEKEEETEKSKSDEDDDFWSGKKNKATSKNNNQGFWKGKGSNSEEASFDKNTLSKESNQFIGEIESKTTYIKIVCRDHGSQDGDRVQIRNNKRVVKSDLYLTKSSKSITLKLNFGMNRLDFKALNQGSSGANTAEFDIYDDKGKLISTKKWDLLTGYTGTLLIVKL